MNEIEEIKKLKSRYFHALDTKDWDAFREVFAADFISDTTGSAGKVINGADNFVSYVRKTLSSNSTVHHGHMPQIELTSSDTARGIWAMEDLVRFLGFIDLHGYGHYHEEYRKVDAQWRISYSKLTRLRMDIRVFIFSVKIPQSLIRRMNKKTNNGQSQAENT
jgi:hypothetical protein